MAVTVTSSGMLYPDGIIQSSKPMFMGGTNPTYNIGTFLMTSELNPNIPQALLNATPNDASVTGYIEAYASWYNTTSVGTALGLSNSAYSTIITGYRCTTSATNALTGTWRACGWAADGDNANSYFYIFFRRVA